MPTVLITGASSGIGRATALYFAQQGWNVAATMRTPEKEQVLEQKNNIRLYRLDVTEEASIQHAVEGAIHDFGAIDVLVNNAGFALVGPFEAATPEQIQQQFEVNVFGLMNVTRALLPHFRERRSGTIINVASMGGRLTFPLYSLYHSTKWAVEGFSESLKYELRPFNIRVKLIEPGVIKTDFYGRSQDLVQKEGLTAYDEYSERVSRNVQQSNQYAQGPHVVARAIWKAAKSKSQKLRYPVASGAPLLLRLRQFIGERPFNAIIRKVLERG